MAPSAPSGHSAASATAAAASTCAASDGAAARRVGTTRGAGPPPRGAASPKRARHGSSASSVVDEADAEASATVNPRPPGVSSFVAEAADAAASASTASPEVRATGLSPVVFSAPDLPHGELSNFFSTPVRFCGVQYPTSEHAYQAQKLLGPSSTPASRRAAALVCKQSTPFKAKLLASLNPPRRWAWQAQLADLAATLRQQGARQRDDWERVRLDVMLSVLRCKFRHNSACRAVLLATGERPLVERSRTDLFWAQNASGVGENNLGRLLAVVRRELRDELEAASANSAVSTAAGAAAETEDVTADAVENTPAADGGDSSFVLGTTGSQ